MLVAAAWPYANGPRHIGHLAGFGVPADVYARYHRLAGNEVLYVSGTDEHGTPISVAAEAEGLAPQQLADRYNTVIRQDLCALGLSYDLFTRTTTPQHAEVVQEVFAGLRRAGVIHEREALGAFAPDGRALPDRYIEGTCPQCADPGARGDQCDGCGTQLDPEELIAPRSRIDGSTPEFRASAHLYLDLPALAPALRQLLDEHQADWRPNAVSLTRALLADLRPRAITRDLDWGVQVPVEAYDTKRFYVWFDAVIGYLSASIEWAARSGDPERWRQWWNDDAHHAYFLGKDNIVFHTVVWPAILTGYDGELGPLRLPDTVAASEFLSLEGQKFSSSRGVVLYVGDLLKTYQPDALRYYLIAAGPELRDTEFSVSELHRRVNSELVATWGNLANRTLRLAHRHFGGVPEPGVLTARDRTLLDAVQDGFGTVGALIEACQLKAALAEAFRLAADGNRYFSEQEPWRLVKEDRARAATVLWVVLQVIADLRILLAPFLPFSSEALHAAFGFDGPLAAQPHNLDDEARIVLGERGHGRWEREPLTPRPLADAPALFAKLADIPASA